LALLLVFFVLLRSPFVPVLPLCAGLTFFEPLDGRC
jgi:hypothetical protein